MGLKLMCIMSLKDRLAHGGIADPVAFGDVEIENKFAFAS